MLGNLKVCGGRPVAAHAAAATVAAQGKGERGEAEGKGAARAACTKQVQQKPIAKVKRRTPSFPPSSGAPKVDVPLGSRYFPADRRERREDRATETSIPGTPEERRGIPIKVESPDKIMSNTVSRLCRPGNSTEQCKKGSNLRNPMSRGKMGCRDNADGSRNAVKKARRCRARVSKGIVVRRASRFHRKKPLPASSKTPFEQERGGEVGGNMCKGATNPPCHPASQPAVWDKQAGIWELPSAFHSIHFILPDERERLSSFSNAFTTQ